MEPKEIFIIYQRAKARFSNRGYRTPKHWDKIATRKDWHYFEEFANIADSQLKLVDIGKFFKANFDLRNGNFTPSQFLHKKSFMYYERLLKQPIPDSENKLLRRSLKYIVKYLKENNISYNDYFDDSSIFPTFLVHYNQGNLHKWILAYHCRKIADVIDDLPNDIVEFNLKINKENLKGKMDVWWMQLLNSGSLELLKGFYDAVYKRV